MIQDLITQVRRHRRSLLILMATWGLYFIVLFSRFLEWAPEGLYAGHTNIWSDWSAHIGMANLFAYKSPSDWLAYNPYFSAGKFTYPFMTNLISGLLMRMGVPLIPAFILPSIIYCLFLVIGIYFLLYTFLKSKQQAIQGLSLFFLSSGPGFFWFLRDLLDHFTWDHLLYPPRDYSVIAESQWYAGNVIEALLAPQRACLLGMTLATWALIAFFRGLQLLEAAKLRGRKYWVFSGSLIGLLSWTHAHSLIAVSPGLAMVVGYQLFRRREFWKHTLFLTVPAAVLGILNYFVVLRGGIQTSSFQSWSPGWTSSGGVISWLMLWFKIWGLALPIAVWGYFRFLKETRSIPLQLWMGSFFLLFIIGNLIFFQPMAWDNSKIFFWSYLIFCGLIARQLNELYGKLRVGRAFLLILLVLSLTGSGLIEDYRMLWISKNRALMTRTEDIELGKLIREKTGSRDVFLTALTHNHFVMMWGVRPILLGYTAWAWNYGFLYHQTEEDIHKMYQGGESTSELLKKYQVSYVVIGDEEIRNLHANETYFSKNFPLAFQNRNFRIYRVRL